MLWRQVLMPWRQLTFTISESSWLRRCSRFAVSRRNLHLLEIFHVFSTPNNYKYIIDHGSAKFAQESYIPPESGRNHHLNSKSRERFFPGFGPNILYYKPVDNQSCWKPQCYTNISRWCGIWNTSSVERETVKILSWVALNRRVHMMIYSKTYTYITDLISKFKPRARQSQYIFSVAPHSINKRVGYHNKL